MQNPKFTLGIEEEFQVIDPQTRELRSHEQRLVEDGKQILKNDQIKAEMHQAVVEVGTNICQDIQDARRQVTELRRIVIDIAAQSGLAIGAAATHPFSMWQQQLITPHPRYEEILNEMQEAARSNLIFGLHVHVGIDDRDTAVKLMNSVRYFLPHLYALSTNSPFWEGRNTGFKSFRSKIFDKFPRTGIPDYYASATEHDNYINTLIKTNCIDNAKKIWWDVRVHPFFKTIEFRIFDIPMRADETIALAALSQAIIAKLYKLMTHNLDFRTYHRSLINENKWRASRYGIHGKLIDFGKQEEVDTRLLIYELLFFVDDVLDDLGSRHEINYIYQMLDQGTGADRQLAVYEQSGGNLRAVVDYIISETQHGL
ncbi:MAG: carboxylate-amine ligase [Chitinophagales bacterium]|nr:carboxylate-amine ligase [Chitinophagales bacterium]